MNSVEPIRDEETLRRFFDIAQAHDAKKKPDEVSWTLILVLGFNSGFRVSDFTRMTVRELRNLSRFETTAQKTGKFSTIPADYRARNAIKKLLIGRDDNEYALQCKEINRKTGRHEHISRQRVYQIINRIAREAGVKDRIGCHTLRKTFGYRLYTNKKMPIESLRDIFGQSTEAVTRRYIGIDRDQRDAHMKGFYIGPDM